jgi:uncharacterized protein (UPF0276 family)
MKIDQHVSVGLTFFPGTESFLIENQDLIDIIEIEPQTLWYYNRFSNNPYSMDENVLRSIKSLPFPKILHGVGFPVGGSIPPDASHLPLLRRIIDQLDAQWMSEHLSFNRAHSPKGDFDIGFMMPPCQSTEGIEAAVNSIRSVAKNISIPFAVEPGVNYLRPLQDEVPDGKFVASVVESADCDILLDLHNIWANERNGRQSMNQFLNEIPLERVREIHLAGGFEIDGYWLDAHSGAIPPPVFDFAKQIVQKFTNLQALTFELHPSYMETFGPRLRSQLQLLHKLRALCETKTVSEHRPIIQSSRMREKRVINYPSPPEWENTVGALVTGRHSGGSFEKEISQDPGIKTIQGVITAFRFSVISDKLKMTVNLLRMSCDEKKFSSLLADFWMKYTPERFASDEASNFLSFLKDSSFSVKYLPEVIDFEMACINSQLHNKSYSVKTSYDLLAVLESLSLGRILDSVALGDYEVVITREGIFSIDSETGGILLDPNSRLYDSICHK